MPKIKNKPGRPTTYTPELANEICDIPIVNEDAKMLAS